jgi:hypothetical protein
MKVTVDTYDAQIQSLIDRAQAIIERETHWYFGEPRAADQHMDGTGTDTLVLRQAPVDVDDLVVYHRSGPTAVWTVLAATEYEASGRLLLVAGKWARGRRNFRATYQDGFTEPPGDVAQLLLELVSAKWKRRGEGEDMQSETIGDYSYTRADLEKQPTWQTVKNNWRRLRI